MTHAIMLIDDDRVIRTLLCEYFESLSYVVHAFESGSEALAECTDIPIDILICDLQMPVMDGLMLLKKFRALKQFSTTPVIMLSANNTATELIAETGLIVQAVILKPFDMHQVKHTVEQLLS